METEEIHKVPVSFQVKEAIERLRRQLGSLTKVTEYLQKRGTSISYIKLKNIVKKKNQKYISRELAEALRVHPHSVVVYRSVEFSRLMAKWYSYFYDIPLKSELAKEIAENTGYSPASVSSALSDQSNRTKRYRVVGSSIEDYLFKSFIAEGFANRDDVRLFLEEMEEHARAYPIFNKVPWTVGKEVYEEIARESGYTFYSLFPNRSKGRLESGRDSLRYSEYARLIRIREDLKSQRQENLQKLTLLLNYLVQAKVDSDGKL